MASWQKWQMMADESLTAATILQDAGSQRPSISRYYYAAFQISTATLLYLRLTPPNDAEGWSHVDTPDLIRTRSEPLVQSRDLRNNLARRLAELYKLRIEADYLGGAEISERKLKLQASSARYVIKFLSEVLPKE